MPQATEDRSRQIEELRRIIEEIYEEGIPWKVAGVNRSLALFRQWDRLEKLGWDCKPIRNRDGFFTMLVVSGRLDKRDPARWTW